MHVDRSPEIVDLTFEDTPSAGAGNSTRDVFDLTMSVFTDSPAATTSTEPSAAMMMDCDKQDVSELAQKANTIPSDETHLARGELIPELKNKLRDVQLDPRILEKAVLQSSPDTVPSWSEEYQRTLLNGDLAYLLQEVQEAGACLAESPASSPSSHSWLGDARGMRAYYLLELWVHRSGLLEFPASFQSLRESLSVSYEKARTVSRIGVYFEYKSFEAARAYVRTFGLKSKKEWNAWRKSGGRPHDIPSTPDQTYKSSGWTSYGDFLGYDVGRVSGSFRTFEDARTYVRTLGLKSKKEWSAWRKSGGRPHDIPSTPDQTYKSSGWTSYGDFLGYDVGRVSGSFRTFEDARTYVRTLGLKSKKEWSAWRKSGGRPHDIPSTPDQTYKSSGWTSYGDFLGFSEGQGARGDFRSFEDARAYVRTLGLKSKQEWETWRKSRPYDIPGKPEATYKSSGWTSFGDFLGYAVGKKAQKAQASKFRAFEDARAYVRTIGLKSVNEWKAWSKSGKRPHDIPSGPNVTYKESGWQSYGDFLGYADGKVAGSFRSFEDARVYVRTLGLKSQKEWEAWRKSGARPHDIPSNPHTVYKSSGWTSYGDFLGFSEGQGARGDFRSFEDARAYVRTLGLKSEKEWKAWRKSDARPHDIPSNPERTYKSSGWTSLGDFLGYAEGKVANTLKRKVRS